MYTYISNLGQDLHKQTGLSKASAIRENVDRITLMGASNRSPKYPQTMESMEPSAINLQVFRGPDLPAVVWSYLVMGWVKSTVVGRPGEFERKGHVAIHNVWTLVTMMMSHSETCHLIAILRGRLVMHVELASGVTVKQHEETMYLFGFV